MPDLNGKYTFLPWMKRGFSGVIAQQEGGVGVLGRPTASVQVSIERLRGAGQTSTVQSVSQDLTIRGPGDVVGIAGSAIIREEPKAGIQNFEWNYLPHIEFFDEDLPWRYTPATGSPDSDNVGDTDPLRLSPWMYLLVLKKSEFELSYVSGRGPFVRILLNPIEANSLFAPTSELWAWAHVQFNKSIDEVGGLVPSDDLKEDMKADANGAFSRLISPRKLEKGVVYQAFVIPTFLSGHQAGMGIDNAMTDSLAYAWPNSPSPQDPVPLEHPYYHTWAFRTGLDGDFETLADRLIPRTTSPDLGVRGMDITKTGWGVDASTVQDAVVGLESALRPPTLVTVPFLDRPENDTYTDSLSEVLNANELMQGAASYPLGLGADSEDPFVLPPMYAQRQALQNQVQWPTGLNEKKWFNELNLDPRSRAVAGIGSTLVKENQETFMEEAWEQVEHVLETNQRIRQAELMVQVAERTFQKHITHPNSDTVSTAVASSADDRLLRMSGPVQGSFVKPGNEETIAREFNRSQIPNAMRSGTFRRMSRPGAKMIKRVSLAGAEPSISAGLLTKSNEVITVDPGMEIDRTVFFREHVLPIDAMAGADIQSNAMAAENQIFDDPVGDEEEDNSSEYSEQGSVIIAGLSAASTLNKGQLATDAIDTLRDKASPRNAVKERVLSTIEIWDEDAGNYTPMLELSPMMAYPEIDIPLYEFLKRISDDYIIPNVDKLPADTVTLLETNPRFMDALFAGVNHEMSRELLWREYPTDMRGTYLRYFWDKEGEELTGDGDIIPIDTWAGNRLLGEQAGNAGSTMVLVIRGELLHKFPDTLIYAVKATHQSDIPTHGIDKNTTRKMDEDAPLIYPDFRARVAGDVHILGFQLTEQEVRGLNEAGTAFIDYGHYFVLQERPGETRFGLDDPDGEDFTSMDNVLKWKNASWGHLAQGAVLRKSLAPLIEASDEDTIQWFRSSSDMAAILYQQPVMMLIHGLEMMEAVPLPGDDDVE